MVAGIGRMEPREFALALLAWYDREGRKDLPWQLNPSPYRVWVSEIMLQQTRVSLVIPFYERFMARFPEVADLAAAEPDEVLHYWSGLGYYARARNLHCAARTLVDTHGGDLPRDLAAIQALPGIGRSTAGAILSLAAGQRHPILDGNVKRVLARCFAVPGWPGQGAVRRRLWALSEACLPNERVPAYNQGLMDLGATLCRRANPSCDRCPLRRGCAALASGGPMAYPEPRPRRSLPVREVRMLAVCNPQGEVLLERRPPAGIWGGLWSLPECAADESPDDWCRERLHRPPARVDRLAPRRHTFSHFHLDIRPLRVQIGAPLEAIADGGRNLWYSPRRPAPVGLAAPIARILREIAES